jgi:hypothetical protein
MSDNSFDLIAHELQKQQQLMEVLAATNRELRRQLADLRAGRGFFIEINGKRIPLNVTTMAEEASQSSSTVTPGPNTTPMAPRVEVPPPPTITDAPTVAITEIKPEMVAIAESDEIPEPQIQAQPVAAKSGPRKITLLEEAMISEFTSAMTSPLATWQDPADPAKKSTKIAEDEKESIRKELMGSYILE